MNLRKSLHECIEGEINQHFEQMFIGTKEIIQLFAALNNNVATTEQITIPSEFIHDFYQELLDLEYILKNHALRRLEGPIINREKIINS